MKPLSIFLCFYFTVGACFKAARLFAPWSALGVIVLMVAACAVVIWEIRKVGKE